MPSVKRRASRILREYGEAQSELIGKTVVLTDGADRKDCLPGEFLWCYTLSSCRTEGGIDVRQIAIRRLRER